MSWTADTLRAGFTTGTPFRAMSGNVANANVAVQDTDPTSLLSFYRNVIALRQSLPSLQRGTYLAANTSGNVMTFQRVLGAEKTLLVFNYGSAAGAITTSGLSGSASLHRLWPVGALDLVADVAGSVNISLPAQSFAVFGVLP
jgi:glycosidase